MCFDVAQGLATGASPTSLGLTNWQTASAGLQVAQTVLGSYQAGRVASAQASAANRAIAANAQAQMNQLVVQQRQMNAQAQQQMSEVARQAARERATLATMAGESGVAGGVLDRLSAELNFKESDATSDVLTNSDNAKSQSYMQGLGIKAQAQGDINRNKSAAEANKPNWLGVGLQLGGIALGLESTASQNKLLAKRLAGG